MTFAYSLTYGNNNNREKQITGNSIMISANADLTPKWKAGISTGYDFVQMVLPLHNFALNETLSWRMDFNWTPLELMLTGDFFGIKSGILSDIKFDKASTPSGNTTPFFYIAKYLNHK
jgi:hypothetical protein